MSNKQNDVYYENKKEFEEEQSNKIKTKKYDKVLSHQKA